MTFRKQTRAEFTSLQYSMLDDPVRVRATGDMNRIERDTLSFDCVSPLHVLV